jgi:hypothetical protein
MVGFESVLEEIEEGRGRFTKTPPPPRLAYLEPLAPSCPPNIAPARVAAAYRRLQHAADAPPVESLDNGDQRMTPA